MVVEISPAHQGGTAGTAWTARTALTPPFRAPPVPKGHPALLQPFMAPPVPKNHPALLQPFLAPPVPKGHPALLQPLPDRPDLPDHKAPPGLLLPSRGRKGCKGHKGHKGHKGRKGPPGPKVRRDHPLPGAPLSIDPRGPARFFQPITGLPCTPRKRLICRFQSETM